MGGGCVCSKAKVCGAKCVKGGAGKVAKVGNVFVGVGVCARKAGHGVVGVCAVGRVC